MSARFVARLRGALPRGIPMAVPVIVLLGWQAGGDLGWIDPDVLPAPIAVARASWHSLLSGELLRTVEISAWRAAVSFAIGGSVGFTFGLLNALSGLAAKLTDSTLQMVRNIPYLALIPLVILWFGIGEGAKSSWWRSACSSRSTSTRCTACARSIRT